MVKVKEPKKEVVKKDKPVPTELVNERQETMFDTDLSAAADAFSKSTMEKSLWKDRNQKDERDLIEHMKRLKITKLVMGNTKVINYKHVDAKDVLQLKDFKPKKRGFRNKRQF